MKFLLFGLLSAAVLGCNDSTPPASVEKSTTEQPSTSSVNHTAATDRAAPNAETVDRSNTAVNARDRGGTAATPLDQNENKGDIGITADIRKRVMATKMSVDAHNVKIITQDGKVTLRGPVATDAEKKSIEDIALDVAGAKNVDSQLEVVNK